MSDKIKHLDDDNFTSETAKGLVLVDFYADWCGPCRMMSPIIEELADQMNGTLTVGKLDIDSSQKTTTLLQVTSILFKDGRETKRIVGLKDLETLKKLIS
jgi:thioredoxin 1